MSPATSGSRHSKSARPKPSADTAKAFTRSLDTGVLVTVTFLLDLSIAREDGLTRGSSSSGRPGHARRRHQRTPGEFSRSERLLRDRAAESGHHVGVPVIRGFVRNVHVGVDETLKDGRVAEVDEARSGGQRGGESPLQ